VSDIDLALLGDTYIDTITAAFPTMATLLGVHDHDAELGSFDAAAMDELASDMRALRRQLDGVSDPALSPSGRVDRKFLANAIASVLLEVEGTQWWRRNPEFAVEMALTGLFFPMIREFAPAADRARSIEARLRRVPSFLLEARTTLGDTPAVLVDIAAQSADAGAALADGAIPAWARALGRDGGPVVDAAPAAAEALREHAAWLRDEYRPRATAPVGVGEEMLARIVSTNHLLQDGPDAIARRGETMLARVRGEIAALAGEMGYPNWRGAVADVKKDLPSAEELVAAYDEQMRWSRDVVRERGLATAVENAPLEVRETPPFWRHTMPYAAYTAPGPFDADQRGVFWVTPPDGDLERLKGHARPSIAVTAIHEGFPGHHLQLTRANRHPSRVRRLADSSLLIEGWAFYCEEMAHEEGLLSREARLCQLKDELWRACRIVIDMRLHQGAMSPEQAVEMLVREADLERPNAEAEVRRYAYSPGYQMAYAIGKEEILRLRAEVKAAEGSRFSLAGFHDRVLDEGSMPVPLVAEALLGRKA
jgi:uncharacterized protein (DUF885 family)